MRPLLSIALVAALAGCAPPGPANPPAGITANTPELFGLGTITTAENELNAAFSPDGRTVYFTRKAGDGGRFAAILASSALPDGKWGMPEVVSFSGRYADYDPILSPDGSRLFFISYRPVTGRQPKRDLDIWVAERSGDDWGEPANLGAPVNTDGDELYPSVALDGTLYFSSCGRRDSRGRCDIYRSHYRDGRYLEPENLGDAVNTPASETDAYIAPDQSYLVVTVYGRTDAVGDGDLYLSEFREGAWTGLRHLGPQINSVAREYCPIVSPDGEYLYFTSQRGFTDAPPERGLTYRELRDSLSSVRNGFGNVYRVPLASILGPR